MNPDSELRRLRRAKGWTQAELARRARCALRTVVTAEGSKGARPGQLPRRDIARRLLRALGEPFARFPAVFGGGE